MSFPECDGSRLGTVAGFDGSDGVGNAVDELLGGFDETAGFVFFEVAMGEDDAGVFGEVERDGLGEIARRREVRVSSLLLVHSQASVDNRSHATSWCSSLWVDTK